jgi:hypothetical protein
MGRPLATDIIGSPTRWLIVFDRKAASWWASLIALGRYKHVRAFGYVHDADAYIFYDVQFSGTRLQLARGDGARALMLEWTADADVLAIDQREKLQINQAGDFGRFSAIIRPLLCTTAIAHLVGLPGALRPDAFFRQCLSYGATPVGGLHGEHLHAHDHRSRDVPVEGR